MRRRPPTGNPVSNGDMFLTRREAEILIETSAVIARERLDAHRRDHAEQAEALDKAHVAHEEKHRSEAEAVKTALVAVARERTLHAQAHEREHVLTELAIHKAERVADKQFGEIDRRFDEMREAIRVLEQTDVRIEGHGLGRGSTVGAIVTAITVAAAAVGALVVVFNLLISTPTEVSVVPVPVPAEVVVP